MFKFWLGLLIALIILFMVNGCAHKEQIREDNATKFTNTHPTEETVSIVYKICDTVVSVTKSAFKFLTGWMSLKSGTSTGGAGLAPET